MAHLGLNSSLASIVARQTFDEQREQLLTFLAALDGKEKQLVFLYAAAVSNSITASECLGEKSAKFIENARDQKFIEGVIVALLKLVRLPDDG